MSATARRRRRPGGHRGRTTFRAGSGTKAFTVNDGTANKPISIDFTGKTIDQVITAMNTALTGANVTASKPDGKITLTNG